MNAFDLHRSALLQRRDLVAIAFGLVLVSTASLLHRPQIGLAQPQADPIHSDRENANKLETQKNFDTELLTYLQSELKLKGIEVAVRDNTNPSTLVFVNKLPLFHLGQALPTKAAQNLIQTLVKVLHQREAKGSWSFRIDGHTDAKPFVLLRGPYYNNDELALARAQKTQAIFSRQCTHAGLSCAFSIKAYGAQRPWSQDPLADVNRRFDVAISWSATVE